MRLPLSRTSAIAAGLLALAACAPDLGPKPSVIAPAQLASSRSFAAPTADWPADRWWDAYGDAQLTQLIDEALKDSPTLAQAEARLRRARAQAQVARSATLPALSANGQVAETETSKNMGYPPFIQDLLPTGYQDNGRLTIDASYDLDLFGRNRAALKAATSEAEAARADAAQARLTLSTAVAQAYADLVRLHADRDAAQRAFELRSRTQELVAQRVSNGLDTQAELNQAKANTPSSRADLAALDEQIAVAGHRLAALVGAGPDRALDITAPKAGAARPFGLPANLAADLVGRRPDVVAARLRVEAAAKRIDVARADFYPNINLAAYAGQQAIGLEDLFAAGSRIGNLAAAVRLPLFQGGRLQGAYRGARADYDAAVAAYDQTLVQAFQDVADTAASVQSVKAQLDDRRAALAAGEAAYRVARLRYEGGLSTLLNLLSAEDSVIAQRRAVADLEARAFAADVALVRALGGGFSA